MSRGLATFTLTTEHLTLARGLYVEWHSFRGERDEYGVPAIGSKRPYGNSDVAGDVIDALGWDCPDPDDEDCDEAEYERVRAKAWAIHREMEMAMELLLGHAGTVALPGPYRNEAKSEHHQACWRRVKDRSADLSHLSATDRCELARALAINDLADTTVACERERLIQGERGIEARMLGRDPIDVALLAELLDESTHRAWYRKVELTALEQRLTRRVRGDVEGQEPSE
jgi:hypothetical protein